MAATSINDVFVTDARRESTPEVDTTGAAKASISVVNQGTVAVTAYILASNDRGTWHLIAYTLSPIAAQTAGSLTTDIGGFQWVKVEFSVSTGQKSLITATLATGL